MTAFYNEYDPKAAAWLRELIKRGLIADGVVDERSILDVQPDDLRGFTQCHFFAGIGGWSLALRMSDWPDDRPVWTGSPPCQPFSAAGRQKGKDDERHLAPHFASLVAACQPVTLFGEQVASSAVFGKAASGARKAADGDAAPEWAWLDDLFERLEAAHYACGASDIPAAGVGAAHIRQRTFFGAVRLADADDARSQGRPGVPERAGECLVGAHGMGGRLAHPLHAGRPEWRPLAGDGSVARGSGGLCGVADADRGQRGRVADGEGRLGHGAATGWQPGDGEPERGGTGGGVGNTSGPAGERDARSVPAAQEGERGARVTVDGGLPVGLEHAGAGVGRVADPLLRQEETGRLAGDISEIAGRGKTGRRADAPDLGWSSADWLFCRDGKWRPVEPGTFPLAHGIPARVGRLRGYGNAIDPRAAAEFIQAFDAAAQHLRLDLSILTQDEEDIFG